MTWNRAWQSGFELQMEEEFTRLDGVFYSTDVTADDPKTGDYGIYDAGRNGGAGWFCPASVAVRGGFWLKWTRGCTSTAWLVTLSGENRSQNNANIAMNADEESLSIWVQGAEIERVSLASSGLSTTERWMHIGFHAKSGGSGFIDFYVDGVLVISDSTASMEPIDGFNALVAYTTGWVPYIKHDDMYFEYGDGTEAREAPPAYRYLYSNTDGPGSNNDFTSLAGGNYTQVDDTVVDNDASYVYASSVGLIDTFTTGNISLPDYHGISSVIPVCVAKKASVDDSQLKMVIFDGATTKKSSSGIFVFMDYDVVFDRFTTDADDDPWTESEVNSSEFGYESAGTI